MSLLPDAARGPEPERDHPGFVDRRQTVEETRRAWAVRAAQWQAVALAEEIFDGPVQGSLLGLRSFGGMRGLLRLAVPFDDVEDHREREARFMAAASLDPILAQVPLVYVFGAREG